MASNSTPFPNVTSGYTVITQVIPSSSVLTTAEQNSSQLPSGPTRKFLKGEPKALGTVQIVIGVVTILFGIVMAIRPQTISVYSGVIFWGSVLHISAGSLTVSASNKLNKCVLKGAMVMNILSTVAAGIGIILLSLDLVIGPLHYCYYYDGDYKCGYGEMSRINGISGILLIFSMLQFIISIIISSFTCKATCHKEPTLNIVNVVPNPDGRVPVVSSFSAPLAQPAVSTMNALAMSGPPVESPPAYSEKGQPDN